MSQIVGIPEERFNEINKHVATSIDQLIKEKKDISVEAVANKLFENVKLNNPREYYVLGMVATFHINKQLEKQEAISSLSHAIDHILGRHDHGKKEEEKN